MDHLSSPTSNSSSISTAPPSVTKQPTYTTAGTIYNPSSSLPLQPPTRRGRSTKWHTGSSELLLFPKTLLASLASKTASISGRPVAVRQQYTPLQQNYDRAISPHNDLEHTTLNMSIQPPRMRSGNTPAPLSLHLPDKDSDKAKAKDVMFAHQLRPGNNDQDGDLEDTDDDLVKDPLLNMTVKSLQNLASYPNPNQKRAQKALLRGARPNMTALTAMRMSTSPTSAGRTAVIGDDLTRDVAQQAVLSRPVHSDVATMNLLPTTRSPSPAVMSVDGAELAPASTTLSSGPGAPRPLTAGPPGQRQYCPTAFDRAYTTPINRSQTYNMSKDDVEALATTQRALAHAGLDDVCSIGMDLYPIPFSMTTNKEARSPLAVLVENSEPEVTPAYQGSRRAIDSLLTNTWDADMDKTWMHWRDSSLSVRSRYIPSTARLTPEALAARNERIDSLWYAGTDGLSKDMDEIIRDSSYRKLQHAYGAIGDGRPKKKAEYMTINMEAAKRMTVSEHTEPLLNMAFASLVRQADDKTLNNPLRQFATPARSLCDTELIGQSSFFVNES
ncbi:hypothetical protein CDD82_83 [Ophiocordyceps australis]|uniref:Uncharacterized protein n=1 Tax=Ophiocordyceps australis TaxID=1399860 RepID=A0A2C5ZIE0_9HYPO|nr:hypothetical protein CDD82_83 [Ophiocordyceps australis]